MIFLRHIHASVLPARVAQLMLEEGGRTNNHEYEASPEARTRCTPHSTKSVLDFEPLCKYHNSIRNLLKLTKFK